MFNKILVPLDGSPFSEKALPFAASLASRYDVMLVLMHVTEHTSLHLAAELPEVYHQVQAEQNAKYRSYLEGKAQSLTSDGLNVSIEVYERGSIAEAILERATALECDLIVMSTHGRSGVQRFLLGSVAERVLRHATMPVMLISASSAESD